VTIEPETGQSGTLVIVAKPNGRSPGYEDRGVWFQGGLILSAPSNVRLFVVTEGDVGITHEHSASSSNDMRALSVVAGGSIELMGPNPGYMFKLEHDSSMDAFADLLVSNGALPPTSGGAGTAYAYAPASWKESRFP
jgi:hypothetical protein